MKRYRSLWLSGWGAVACICVGIATLVLPAPAIFVLFTITATGAGLATVGYYRSENRMRPCHTNDLVRMTATHAVAAGVVIVGLLGLVVAGGVLAWPLLVVAVVSSPWTLALVGRRAGGSKGPDANLPIAELAPSPTVVLPPAVDALSDRELCRVWRTSFDALQSATTAQAHENIVALRRACMDEFERRAPAALNAWLDSGARAAGGPDKYLSVSEHEGHEEAS